MLAGDADLTVVVVPREKYRLARSTLSALLGSQDPEPFRLVWVDEARAPRALRQWVADQAVQHRFTHLPLPDRCGANECRARGFERATTTAVLFLDNDATPGIGTLSTLMDCIRTTDATFVAPLYLEHGGAVHHAGGRTTIVDGPAGRRLVEHHRHGPVAEEFRRAGVGTRSDALEMHGVLVRASALRSAGGLDTALRSSMDCADLSLRLGQVDGGGRLEPAATVTYNLSLPRVRDLPLFFGRWSRATVAHDVEHFATSWDLDPDEPCLALHRDVYLRARRMRVVRYARGAVRRVFGEPTAARFERLLDRAFDLFADAGAPRTG